MKNASEIFNSILNSKEKITVKLLGDSITHGVGGEGFEQIGEHIVTCFSRSPHSYCWANLFRDYMLEKYGATVINNACTGTKIEFIIEHFDELVSPCDDVVICTIGTNNRHWMIEDGPKPDRDVYFEQFYGNILKLHELFVKAEKAVILVANIPASAANEQDTHLFWRVLHMDDINAAYKRAATDLDFPFISMYDLFNGYCAENSVSVNELLCDGLHPNNRGYDVMFSLIKGALSV